jgi:hypothetical protein
MLHITEAFITCHVTIHGFDRGALKSGQVSDPTGVVNLVCLGGVLDRHEGFFIIS